MRIITILFLLALIIALAYFLVPVEKIQSKAKQTVQDMQAKSPSHNLEDITAKLGEILDKEDTPSEETPSQNMLSEEGQNEEAANKDTPSEEIAEAVPPQAPTQTADTTTPAE